MEKTITKVYVDNEGFVVFVCSNCNLIQKQEAKTYGGVKGPIQIQCTCGNVYDVEIEFRKFYRKGIRVDGLYFGITNPKIWGKMVLKNVSMQGCGFETMGVNPLQPGDSIRIEFQLNDAKRSVIKKQAAVRSIFKKYVGCQFQDLPNAMDADLGF
ncbi:MAG TPA: PilZ domain-containing protein, partial [Smithellaceae bacterium]|nr:PilZ domain-containing protein [Smithellaceae bacterium]